MTVGWAFHTWYNVVAFPITEGPQWTRGFTSNVVLTCCYITLFLVAQILWSRDIKKGLYKRAIEEEEDQEAIAEKLDSKDQDENIEKPVQSDHVEHRQGKEVA